MANSGIKIKDLPLLTSLDGSEIVPTGGKGNFAFKVETLLKLIASGISQVIDSRLNEVTGGTKISHKDVALTNSDISNNSLVLNIDGFDSFSYKFTNETVGTFSEAQVLSISCPQDGVYNLVLDTKDIKDPIFEFDNVFYNLADTVNKDTTNSTAIFCIQYTQIGNFKQAICHYRWVDKGVNPPQDQPYVSYNLN